MPAPALVRRIVTSPQAGLLLVIVLLGTVLTLFAGTHLDRRTGVEVNNFLNSNTLIQTATDASFFAIMAVGATFVIISGGIDLSVGSIYALAGVSMALLLRAAGPLSGFVQVALGLTIASTKYSASSSVGAAGASSARTRAAPRRPASPPNV